MDETLERGSMFGRVLQREAAVVGIDHEAAC